MSELEAGLAKFKAENVESRPELEELTRSLINRNELELAELDRRVHSATQQKIYLEGELGQLDPFRSSHGDIDSPEQRLEQVEAALAAAEANYGQAHPDVIRLRKQAESLRSEVDPAASRKIIDDQIVRAQQQLGELIERYGDEHPDVVAARRTIVEGAVGMVEDALELLNERDVVELDEERKATMVSNLLVVLTSENQTTPVVNTGSLY